MNESEIPVGRKAPDGHVWQCAACGKESEDLFGIIGWHARGWDESCMLNAVAVADTRQEHHK